MDSLIKFFELDEASVQRAMLNKHARVMIMMFEATGDERYLDMSLASKLKADHIQVDFVRPIGALYNKVA